MKSENGFLRYLDLDNYFTNQIAEMIKKRIRLDAKRKKLFDERDY
jgi:hypothetical protein